MRVIQGRAVGILKQIAPSLLVGLLALIGGPAGAATEAELQSAVFRAKPAVVMIGVEVGATATVRCAGGPAQTVRAAPLTWIGSGSIIHPEGWVVTNGHVVQPFYEKNEATFGPQLLERAVWQACRPLLEPLAGDARRERIRALAADPANRGALWIEKKLTVNLSNGKMYAAEVKFYSPPAYVEVGTTREASGAVRKEHGRDVAILKFEGRDLPVVRLARRSTDLNLGQTLFVIGFPGVVAEHELLSQATRFEPSVTVGRVSGFKQDVGGQRVIQTDAAIIQGNSGGPVFDYRGNVIGAATFTSLQGDQVVQGFNFAIPVETIHEAANKAGLTPQGESPFTQLWNHGVDLYIQDLHYRAYRNMSAANAIHPGFPDVERVREDCDLKHKEQGYLHREEVQWGVMGFGIVGAVAGVWFGGRRAAAAARRRLRQMIREELQEAGAARG